METWTGRVPSGLDMLGLIRSGLTVLGWMGCQMDWDGLDWNGNFYTIYGRYLGAIFGLAGAENGCSTYFDMCYVTL